jgi:hypothetical protein
VKNEDKPNFPMDKNDEIQSSSKKRKEHPVDMLANKTKTELLAEAHSAGIKGTPVTDRIPRALRRQPIVPAAIAGAVGQERAPLYLVSHG